MAKYGIGVKVTDPNGQSAEIVGKPGKGLREVRYSGGIADGVLATFGKGELTAVAVNDNAAPWEPKVGDLVTLKVDSVWHSDTTNGVGVVHPKDPAAASAYVGVKFDGDDFLWHIEPKDLLPSVAHAPIRVDRKPEVTVDPGAVQSAPSLSDILRSAFVGQTFRMRLAAPPERYIICLVENGQPLPSAKPHVHRSRDAADREQNRLARKHPGKDFAIYRRVSTIKADVSIRKVS